jgi:SAM-dependent methyltransferase
MDRFDEHSSRYSQQVEDAVSFSGRSHEFFLEAKARHFLQIIAPLAQARGRLEALDVGCGTGQMHRWLRSTGLRLHGTDPSVASLGIAGGAQARHRLAAALGQALPFPDAFFDVAVITCVLHHVAAEVLPELAAELLRVLKPGGQLVVFEHNPYNPLTRLAVARCAFDEDAVLLPARRTRRLLSSSGFAIEKTRYFLFAPLAAPGYRRFEGLLGWLPLGAQYYLAASRPACASVRDAGRP